MHCLIPFIVIVVFIRSSPVSQREALLELMWSVWPDLPVYGSKAAQFVDLLGYFTIKTPQSSEQKVNAECESEMCHVINLMHPTIEVGYMKYSFVKSNEIL
jgi:hypothetical protein